jgi:hypothetical protein
MIVLITATNNSYGNCIGGCDKNIDNINWTLHVINYKFFYSWWNIY